jgi:alpha/beta superfamily hydrolase
MYKAVELKVDEKLLRGCVRIPDNKGPFPTVCFFHGFNVDKVGFMRLHETFARLLVNKGFACVRFDFYGCGESEGDFHEMRISDEIKQGKAIYEWTKKQDFVDAEEIYPIGHSLGAVIASLVAAEYQSKGAVLWSPALAIYYDISGRVGAIPEHYQKSYDYEGLEISGNFFEDARRLDLLGMAKSFRGKVLVVHGEKDEKAPIAVVGQYRDIYGDAMELEIVTGSNHQFSSLNWKQEVYDKTIGFLKKTAVH